VQQAIAEKLPEILEHEIREYLTNITPRATPNSIAMAMAESVG